MPYRLFIAAELPPAVKDALLAAQAALRAGGAPVRWVAPAAMHLTLRFLGDTDESLAAPIGAALQGALAGAAAPALRLAAAGAFPSLARPSALWLGVAGDTAALQAIHRALEAALGGLGIAPEGRPLSPHLTIGRVRRDAAREAAARVGGLVRALPPPDPAPFYLERVTLFRSELRPAGALHTPLASCDLPIAR